MSGVVPSELLQHSITELAALVRAGELSARELVGASLERIDALDDGLNAFAHVDHEGALATAATIGRDDPRPFAGVPIAVKDLRAVAGMPLGYGSRLFDGFVPDYDSYVVRRLRSAGFVIVGKTNLPEFGIAPVTESARHGATRNPLDRARTPGGSSGGSAAAVAAGMVPIAHANDGGGSTRIPAACCGLVGLKPQRGRISLGPEQGDNPLAVDGVLTRTVQETARVLDVLAGYETGDATWAPPPAEPFATAATKDPGRLRIAVTSQPPLEHVPVDPACEAGVRRAAELLAHLGHEVREATPAWRIEGLFELFADEFCSLVAAAIAFGGAIAGHPPRARDVEPLSWYVWQRAQALSAPRFLLGHTRLAAVARALTGFFDQHDILLTPALAQLPVEIGAIDPLADDAQATFMRAAAFTPFTALANVTGLPAIAVPIDRAPGGLPLAIQLQSGPAQEGRLLALAGQLEAVCPWGQRSPEHR